jgi:nicotinamide/nicotinate riboside kinase
MRIFNHIKLCKLNILSMSLRTSLELDSGCSHLKRRIGCVVGIGGVSRSGKTTLAKLVCSLLVRDGYKVIMFSQDDFVFPEEQIPKILDIRELGNPRARTNWEIPESIDFRAYEDAIVAARNDHDFVVTEGLLNFFDSSINALFDKLLFTSIPKEVFLMRKAVDTRWGTESAWYIEHIWNCYEEFGKSIFEDDAQTVKIFSGCGHFDETEVKLCIYEL